MPESYQNFPDSSNKITLRKIEVSAAMNRCGWSEADRSRYLALAGVTAETLETCSDDEINLLYFRAVESRLIRAKGAA